MARTHDRAPARLLATALGCAVVLAACSGERSDQPVAAADISETVPIGAVPGPLTDAPVPSEPPNLVSVTTTSTTEPPPPLAGPIGESVDGDRLLLIGDGVLARTSPRFDGIACEVLTDFGWDVEVAAEPGRFIEFGHEVLDARFDPDRGEDWDAVVILLGNLFDGDLAEFETQLGDMIERLAPRPVVLFTLTEVDDEAAVNRVIRAQPEEHPNVVVVEWARISAAESDVLLDDGGPIPTEEGAGRLVVFIAGELGRAPGGSDGACLPEVFTDDSAIVL